METLPYSSIPSAESSGFGAVFQSGPLAQIRTAFPRVAVDPGSLFDAILLGIQIISALLSVAILIGIVILVWRSRLAQKAARTVEDVITTTVPHDAIADAWGAIQALVASDRPNDWKLAVIDADKLLEFTLRHFPVKGETLADKLKEFDRSELSVIDDVWRAHKLRNALVHGDRGSVTQEEARVAARAIEGALRDLGALS